MKVCSRCMIKMGLIVRYPHMLDPKVGCDECEDKSRKSWKLYDIKEQIRITDG